MEKIFKKLRTHSMGEYSLNGGSYHGDMRKDIDTMAKYCNMLANKINELSEEIESLKTELGYTPPKHDSTKAEELENIGLIKNRK